MEIRFNCILVDWIRGLHIADKWALEDDEEVEFGNSNVSKRLSFSSVKARDANESKNRNCCFRPVCSVEELKDLFIDTGYSK
jgi:hypothetical protein